MLIINEITPIALIILTIRTFGVIMLSQPNNSNNKTPRQGIKCNQQQQHLLTFDMIPQKSVIVKEVTNNNG
jgi:hypothetical protein